jgi:hypothetical protein
MSAFHSNHGGGADRADRAAEDDECSTEDAAAAAASASLARIQPASYEELQHLQPSVHASTSSDAAATYLQRGMFSLAHDAATYAISMSCNVA